MHALFAAKRKQGTLLAFTGVKALKEEYPAFVTNIPAEFPAHL